MRCRIWWWLGLAGAVAMWPGMVKADTGSSGKKPDLLSESHIRIDFHGMDLQKALAERFQALNETSKAKKYSEQWLKKPEELIKDEKKIDQLKEWSDKGQLPLDLPDPLVRNLEAIFNLKKTTLSPKQREKIGSILQAINKKSKSGFGAPEEKEGGSLPPEGGGELSPSRDLTDPEAGQGRFNQPPFGAPPPTETEAEPTVQKTLAGWLAENQEKFASWLAENVEMEEGSWADSPGLREFIRELRRPHLEMGDGSGLDENTWSGKFAGLSRSLVQSSIWQNLDWSRLGKLGALPSINLPKVDLPRRPRSPMGIPNFSLPSGSNWNRGLGLLWVGLVILLGVVVWKYLLVARSRQAGKGRAWKLGPWPVSPAAVATWEELILAFEYLSLLKLGPAARSQNHLALAEALTDKKEDRRNAAQHLAALYEMARYAPERDPISDDALKAARRELCFLADPAGA